MYLNKQDNVEAQCVDDRAWLTVLGQTEKLFVVADRAQVKVCEEFGHGSMWFDQLGGGLKMVSDQTKYRACGR